MTDPQAVAVPGWPGSAARWTSSATDWVDEDAGLLVALESFANEGGLISAQVWDAPDIPEHELFVGKSPGSANPLVWAHAEHLKLRRSLRVVELDTAALSGGQSVTFTFYWPGADRWEGTNFSVRVGPEPKQTPEPGRRRDCDGA